MNITNIIDKVPSIFEGFRNLITKLMVILKIPGNNGFMIFAAILSLFLAYMWIKQFVFDSWGKISTILNLVLLTVIFYLLLVYV